MRKAAVTLITVIVVGLMAVPCSVSGTDVNYVEAEDREGDIAFCYDFAALDYRTLLGESSPIVKAGYFDMRLFWFSLEGDMYTFGMQLAADLPKEGDPLPSGVRAMQYEVWLDEDAWDWSTPVVSYFEVYLGYDGYHYSAALREPGAPEPLKYLDYEIAGPTFEVRFSAADIGYLPEFWLGAPAVTCLMGASAMELWPDIIDLYAAEGQVYTSIKWPPVIE
jgi:hypothetical protein